MFNLLGYFNKDLFQLREYSDSKLCIQGKMNESWFYIYCNTSDYLFKLHVSNNPGDLNSLKEKEASNYQR